MNANYILQRGGGIVRGTARFAERFGRRVISDTFGIFQRVRHLRPSPKPGMDDVTLTRKVETEIFRGARAPKDTVNVNVVDGVVWLRGDVKRPEQIRSLERKARAVPEVRGVENLLHLTKTPAPTRADAPKRQQRTRSTTKRPTPRKASAGVTADRTGAITGQAEPSPAEHAVTGEGRTPAPLGATGEGGTPEPLGATGDPGGAGATGESGETAAAGARGATGDPGGAGPTGDPGGTGATGAAEALPPPGETTEEA
jgi:hypothetical protein